MTSSGWTWANLNSQQLNMIKEAEQTLGADILLAYQQGGQGDGNAANVRQSGLQAAPLNDSQVECLQGLEDKVRAVVVAYDETNR